jgi:UPF0755 protein
MAVYSVFKRRRVNRFRLGVAALALIVIAALVAGAFTWRSYRQDLKPVDNDTRTYPVIIPSGSGVQAISTKLKDSGFIRSADAFQWYVRLHHFAGKLQAGTYSLSSSQSVPQIVSMMVEGKIERSFVIIKEAQTISQIKDEFKNVKFDAAAVDKAFDPARYGDIPVLADKPAGASLEGYLYPDTFARDATTDPADIVRESLQEMNDHITPEIKAAFDSEGLSVYQGITLASIVENEVNTPNDRAQVAQVFLARLKQSMPFQSDITYNYAQKIGDDAYNTYNHAGLPPGPISNVSETSIQAVAHPAATHWLYFVTGDNVITYFSSTGQEHDKQVQQYCHKLCGR